MKENIIAKKTFAFALTMIDLYLELKEKMNLFFLNKLFDQGQVLVQM